MTNGPYETTGSSIGSAWPNNTSASLCATNSTLAPTSLSCASVNWETASSPSRPMLTVPRITYRNGTRPPTPSKATAAPDPSVTTDMNTPVIDTNGPVTPPHSPAINCTLPRPSGVL